MEMTISRFFFFLFFISLVTLGACSDECYRFETKTFFVGSMDDLSLSGDGIAIREPSHTLNIYLTGGSE